MAVSTTALTRRAFIRIVGPVVSLPVFAPTLFAQRTPGSPVYAAVGPELTQYDVDLTRGALSKRESVTLPANVQEAWAHPSLPLLYVGWSDMAGHHGISVLRVDETTGGLGAGTPPVPLTSRPIHLTIERDGRYLFVAYPVTSRLGVHPLAADGTIGPEVTQPVSLDFGTYAHQVRISPSNRLLILPTRGNEATSTRMEDPGALKVFQIAGGTLTPRTSIAPNGGRAFRPRHLDFHPSGRWMYVTLESQNRLMTFAVGDDQIGATPLFETTTLQRSPSFPQQAGTVHVHPTGRAVYVANRASSTVNRGGTRVFAGGENSIAVFSIDQRTGEPRHLQSVDTRGIHPRTFTIDPTGRVMIVGNQSTLPVLREEQVAVVPAGLSVFLIEADGRLTFVRKHDVDGDAQKALFWVGF